MVLKNKATLCNKRRDRRLQTRACMTTQVHKKIVKKQLTRRLSVPRPEDSRTQPTDSLVSDDGVCLVLEAEVEVM